MFGSPQVHTAQAPPTSSGGGISTRRLRRPRAARAAHSVLGRHAAAVVVVAALSLAGTAATAAAAGPTALSPGASGPAVAALQRALNRASYPAGHVDGNYGEETEQAVIAYQKVHGLARTGAVSASEDEAILDATRPAPPLAGLTRYVYVDLARQVLFEVHGGAVTHTIPVSSGGGYTYASQDGSPHVAVTPTGRFQIYNKVTGWQRSYLGQLYYPSYFDGGYAIHGDTYVPPVPVSHGCVRIPIWLSVGFFDRNPDGTPVIIE